MDLKRLERRFGRFAIENLALYLAGGQAIALVLAMAAPGFAYGMALIPQAVLAGEWWRLLSFLFTPPFGNPFLALFGIYFLYVMGNALEGHWGAFRFNLYVLIGYLLTVAVSFAFPVAGASNIYLTGSIFLAFAYLFPEMQVLLLFIIPVRVKWLALLTWLLYGYSAIFGGLEARVLIAAAVANFFLFFGTDLFLRLRQGQRRVAKRAAASAALEQPRHTCTVCGITDRSHPEMDFRYCTKCVPPVEYCAEHLASHEHRRVH